MTFGRTVERRARCCLRCAQKVASTRDEGREPPIGGGHVEQVTIDVAAA